MRPSHYFEILISNPLTGFDFLCLEYLSPKLLEWLLAQLSQDPNKQDISIFDHQLYKK